MSEPLRTDPAADSLSVAEREGKIEQLLLVGLDHYFDGQYDQAINIWTRALFLDRGHARARAYIERARSALAERQRESEELLQRGLAAFDRGASAEARRLLEIAIVRGAPRDEALAVLDRIDRLDAVERAAPLVEQESADGSHRFSRAPQMAARRLGRTAWIGLALSSLTAAFLILILVTGTFPLDGLWSPTISAPVAPSALESSPAESALPLPRRGERALDRARGLASRGRLRDALVRLDEVGITDEERAEADRLRSDIQRQLLGLGALDASDRTAPASGATLVETPPTPYPPASPQ